MQEEAKKEEKRREREESEAQKQLRKQQDEAEKERRRREKEDAEMKKRLAVQKQASIMERFLEKTKTSPWEYESTMDKSVSGFGDQSSDDRSWHSDADASSSALSFRT